MSEADQSKQQTPSSGNTWERRVHGVMDHVRANPGGDLRLSRLARIAHASPYHFHRMFRSIAGETLAEFTRRARLERAAYLMKSHRRRRLGSIASEVGFTSLGEFSRAFKREYGLPPSRWDRTQRLLPSSGEPSGGAPAADSSPRPEAQITHRHATRLAYVRMRTWFEVAVLKEGFAELTRWCDRQGLDWRRSSLVGMSWDHYETTPLERVHYDLAFEVPHDTSGSGSVGTYDLPSFQAIEVRCQGGLSTIAEAWDYLYGDWFPASRWEPADLPAMKRFRRRPDELEWASWDLDCSIALRPESP